jgi:outer membrane protein insertion porin family
MTKTIAGRFIFLSSFLMLFGLPAHAKIIDTLQIEGSFTTVQASMVRGYAGIKSGDEFVATKMPEAIKRLYYLGLFRSVDFSILNETDSTVSLLLKVVEFPILESFDIVGAKKISKEDVEKVVTLKKGQALSSSSVFETVRKIQKVYAEKGYLMADVALDTTHAIIPGNVIAKFRIKEGSKVEVKQVTFKGNSSFKESKLKGKFKTKEKKFLFGGDFDQEKYRTHLDSLIMFYNDEGYLDAEIVSDSIRYGDNKKDLFISVMLNEGRKYYAGDVFFTGNKVLPTDQLTSQIALKRGKAFNKTRFEMTQQALVSRYREEGYLWVGTKDQRSYRGDTIDVTFDITEGVPAIVRKIDIFGNNKTRDNVVRREIALMPGRKYKQSFMAESVRRLMQLGFFSNVNPDIRPNDDGTVDFVFSIAEKENMGQLQLGAAYSQVQGLSLTFSTAIPNFRGTGEELDLNAQVGKQAVDLSLGFTEPWAFNTPTTLRGFIFYNWNKYTDNTEARSYGFKSFVARELKWPDDKFSVSGGYEISKQQETGSAFSSPILNVRREGVLSRLSFGIRRNDTDKRLFPNSGSILDLSGELAGLGGDYKYAKGIVSIENYYPLFWKLVFGPRAKIGLISSLGSGPISISKYDLFAAGGVYGVTGVIRGYDEQWFGGVREYAQNKGISLLSLNAELRYPVLEDQLYLALFADAGNTWSSLKEIDIMDLYKGVGVGFRLNIPMLGLLGFDFGWGLDDPAKKDGHFGGGYKPHVQTHFIMQKGF